MKNVLSFLDDLRKNNEREWFQANQEAYRKARKEFEDFVAALIPRLASFDKELAGLEAKQCLFRIYRDTRFSHDKTPYKTNMGATMSKGGRKNHFAAYYLHIEPGNIFAGGGIWMPQSPALKAVRQEIFYNLSEFENIIGEEKFKKYFNGLAGEMLKRTPRDFPADFPGEKLLRHKSYAVIHPMDDGLACAEDFPGRLEGIFRALHPFNSFINRALAEV
jgi:uncharacterized protein (TIGR02453 family)